jgi:flagellar protein FliO/FliZ
MAGTLLQTVLSLGLVLGLIFALGWTARRLRQLRSTQGEMLQIESGLTLGARERLVLVRVNGQQFLLGVAAGSVQLLHRFTADSAAKGSAEVIPFGQHLKSHP